MIRPLMLLALSVSCWAQPPQQAVQYANPPVEGDWVAHDFTFHSGEKMAELRLHYTTLGAPTRDPAGHVNNAVIVMHGTGGSGRAFLSAGFGGELFLKGQPLDAATHYIILPDAIGHGKSSKPSDGLHMKFPHYDYEDMVRADYRLLHDGLGVDHLRLVMGTSMGAMHTWVWGELYPDFMDALMPLASATVEIAGRNRMFRAMIIQAIRNDPDWKEGEYSKPPVNGLVAAQYALWMMTSSPLQLHKANPTHDKADAAVAALRERATRTDANDMLYQFECSTDYNPSPQLERIKAPLYAVNSADDEVNPPELGILERDIKRVAHGRYILIPTSDETRGHGTHSRAAVWKNYLVELLRESEPHAALMNPGDDYWKQNAPGLFQVTIATTQGDFTIEAHREWAPRGADRFYNLVRAGFYDDSRFYRVIRGDFAQFGIAGNPLLAGIWRNESFPDDSVKQSNTRGFVAYAMTGPDARTTQVYIVTGDRSRQDKDGFAPFGKVVAGMDVVDKLYSGYGETSGGGMRAGKQARLFEGGNAWLDADFPKLDRLLHARVQ
ncbi:MAG TPA: alpha/beta fold hydrolase [Bryobacteraceae bacterium]|jgi:homoserine O-acetyltransferase